MGNNPLKYKVLYGSADRDYKWAGKPENYEENKRIFVKDKLT